MELLFLELEQLRSEYIKLRLALDNQEAKINLLEARELQLVKDNIVLQNEINYLKTKYQNLIKFNNYTSPSQKS